MPYMHDRFQSAQSFDEAFRGGSQRRSGDFAIVERYISFPILLRFSSRNLAELQPHTLRCKLVSGTIAEALDFLFRSVWQSQEEDLEAGRYTGSVSKRDIAGQETES